MQGRGMDGYRFNILIFLLGVAAAGCGGEQTAARPPPSEPRDGTPRFFETPWGEKLPMAEVTRPKEVSCPLNFPSTDEWGACLESGPRGILLPRCTINIDGSVSGCRMLKSIPACDQAVIQLIESWRFEPTVYHGKPVAILYIFPFRMQGGY